MQVLIPAFGADKNMGVNTTTPIAPLCHLYLLPVIGSCNRNPKVSSDCDCMSQTSAWDFTDHTAPIHGAVRLHITLTIQLKNTHPRTEARRNTYVRGKKKQRQRLGIPQNNSSRKSIKYAWQLGLILSFDINRSCWQCLILYSVQSNK